MPPTAGLFTRAKAAKERKISSSQVINRLRPKLGVIPGAMTFLQAGQDLRSAAGKATRNNQYTIQSENLQDLVKWGPTVFAEMRKLPVSPM